MTSNLEQQHFLGETIVSSFVKLILWNWFPLCMTCLSVQYLCLVFLETSHMTVDGKQIARKTKQGGNTVCNFKHGNNQFSPSYFITTWVCH
jgi:hypothetical protein